MRRGDAVEEALARVGLTPTEADADRRSRADSDRSRAAAQAALVSCGARCGHCRTGRVSRRCSHASPRERLRSPDADRARPGQLDDSRGRSRSAPSTASTAGIGASSRRRSTRASRPTVITFDRIHASRSGTTSS